MKEIKLRDAHEEFKNFLKEKKHSNSTVVAYGKDIDQLISFLEELQKNHIHEVTKDDLEAFLASMGKKAILLNLFPEKSIRPEPFTDS